MPNTKHSQAGWDAIDQALNSLYATEKPHHYGALAPARLGGNNPLQGISVYRREQPVAHWHYVTYGFTELFEKETKNPEVNGYGFELTLRLTRGAEETPPPWVLNFLQNLARYVFKSGNAFSAGAYMHCNGPIASETPTDLHAILFARDPELPEIISEYGKAEFLQVAGITSDEESAIRCWNSEGLTELLRGEVPLLCTDLKRHSILGRPEISERVRKGTEEEGSNTGILFTPNLSFQCEPARTTIRLGARQARSLGMVAAARQLHRRALRLQGKSEAVMLEAGDACAAAQKDSELTVSLTRDAIAELRENLEPKAKEFTLRAFPSLRIVIEKSEIRDQQGNVVEVIG
jgi:suppressor of fused-like protein